MAHHPEPAGVALGFRPELASDLFRAPETADFLEVVAESCFAQPAAWREACALAEVGPVVPHGVKLSLGSAEGVDLARARRLGRLARDVRARVVTEHVAFTRAGGREIGHLTPLPFTREAVGVVARNAAACRRVLPDVPLLLENVAWTFRWPEDAMAEADFYAEVTRATGCGLLLDVANLHANAVNAGEDPLRVVRSYPLDRVAMLHVAGGAWEHGFLMDTHAHPVSDGILALVRAVLALTGPVPIVLERDDDFPPFAELRAEVECLRALLSAAPGRGRGPGTTPDASMQDLTPPARPVLEERQAAVARLLTDVEAPGEALAVPFGALAIARTRAVLQKKRVDEALPLLPRLAAAGGPARRLALRALRGTVRPAAGAGIADALRIAEAAANDEGLAALALRDRLELVSRFAAGRDGAPRPRRGPFVGRQRLPDGRSLWAVKAPGTGAAVRVLDPGVPGPESGGGR